MGTQTVGEFMLERLRGWGVRRVYGYPGDGSTGLNLAFHDSDVEFVQVRHEELAAFAACAHAKLTGEVGICMATSGPGAIHLLNGLYDAKLDHAPVVAVVGQQQRMSLGGDYQQEVDLEALFADVASGFVQTCMTPEQAPHLIDRAMRIAKAYRTVCCVIVPADVQEAEMAEPPRAHGAIGSSPQPAATPLVRPRDEELRRAADVLNAGAKVAMLVGQGARGAADEVLAVADRLGAGIAKALNGRAVVPDDVAHVTGPIGLLGSTASARMMRDCDTLLLVGTSFPYSEWLPEPGQARAVEIDIDPAMIGIRYPTEVNLVGDARETLRVLAPLLEPRTDAGWREAIERDVAEWWDTLAARATADADPVNPRLVFHELSPRLPDEAVLIADSGSATNWWAQHLRMRRGMDAILSGTLATMCPAVPYALAAKLAYPERPVIAALGDGAMQMLGINGLIDLAKYADRFAAGPLVVAVLNNGDLNQVTWEQRVLGGEPKLEASQDLPPFDYAAFARQVGLEGIRVERPQDVGPAWDQALGAPRPVVIDFVTDPEVPPLPPEIRAEHAKGMAKSVAKGDPARGDMIKQSIKGLVNRGG